MTKETMTVHKALAELKIMKTRIKSLLIPLEPCGAKRHSDDAVDGMSIDDYEKKICGDYDRVRDLISRYFAIKRTVTHSNSVTKVKINGDEYTVAEAIDVRSSFLPLLRDLQHEIAKSINGCDEEIAEKNSGALITRADRYIEAIYGDKTGKTNSEEIDAARESFIRSNRYELVDPLDIRNENQRILDQINSLDAEIDAALSVSNATTVIEVAY